MMRKKNLILFMFVLFAQISFGQNVLLNEEFDDFYNTNWTLAGGLMTGNGTITLSDPSFFTWTDDNFGNDVGNGSNCARLNIWGTSIRDWLITPSLTLETGKMYSIEFDFALTTTGTTNSDVLAADDTVAVMISTDDGATWSGANTLIEWTTNSNISTNEHISLDLSCYAGNTVKIGFYGESTVSNNDVDFFVDNVMVYENISTPFLYSNVEELDFEEMVVGDNIISKEIILSNLGTGALTIEPSNVSIIGNDAVDFGFTEIENNIVLDHGDQETLVVFFDPQTEGNKSAALQIIDDVTKTTHEIALSGKAFPEGSLLETFDGTFAPQGWEADGLWSQSTYGGYDDNFSAYLISYTNFTDAGLITPKLTLNGSCDISFFAKASSNEPLTIKVQYSADKETWTDVSEAYTIASDWTNYSTDLSSIPAGNYYIAFSASGKGSLKLDYVLGPPIASELPAAVVMESPSNEAENVALNAELRWSPSNNGGIPEYFKLYLGTSSGDYSLVNGEEQASPYSYEFEYGTTYYWKIQPVNSVGETDIADCPEWSFTTMADPVESVPYFNNFNDCSVLPENWGGYFYISSNGVDNTNCLIDHLSGYMSSSYIVTMPLIGITEDTKLFFDYRFLDYYTEQAYVFNTDSLIVLVSNDGENTWNSIDVINQENHVATTEFTRHSVSLADYVDDRIKIKILVKKGNGDYNVYVDNFIVGMTDEGATINPDSVIFDLNNPADVVTQITWNGASAIEKISDGTNELVLNEHYTVSDNTLTFVQQYLDTVLTEGGNILNLNIDFDFMEDVTFVITATQGLPLVNFNVDMNTEIDLGEFTAGIDNVYLSGSFNSWAIPGTAESIMMTDADGDGIYSASIELENNTYEYKYYKNDENGIEWTGMPNRIFTVEDENMVLNDIWANKYLVSFLVSDENNPLAGAQIIVDGKTLTTGDNGMAKTSIVLGDVYYTVILENYEEFSGLYTVTETDNNIEIEMSFIPYPIPFVEHFEENSFDLPEYWTGSNTLKEQPNHGLEGSSALSCNMYSTVATADATTMLITGFSAETKLSFFYRFVNFTSYPDNATELGDDKLEVIVNKEDGSSDVVYTIDASNHTTSADFQEIIVDLADYAGQTIKISFVATWAAGDYFVDIDDININNDIVIEETYNVVFNVDMNKPIENGDFVGTDVVYLAGSMNEWLAPGSDENMMMTDLDNDNIYTVTLELKDGDYEYKYFKNAGWSGGEWDAGENRKFTVSGADLILNDEWGPNAVNDLVAEVSISPNPTVGLISIVAEQNYNVQIINTKGEVIAYKQLVNKATEIDISDKPVGLYFVRLYNEKENYTYKIIKE